MASHFKQSWTGNFYKAAYEKLVARGEDDVFFSGSVVADFTGDGIADILQAAGNNAYGQERGATPSHGQFTLLAGRSNGTFVDATSLLPSTGINAGPQAGRIDAVMRHLDVGDVNGDGRPDFVGSLSYEDGRLIGAGNGSNIAVQQVAYLSDGPAHWSVVELDNLTWGHGLEVDDFDGDGRDDIITGGFTITEGHQGGTVLSQFPMAAAQTNTPLPIGGGTYQLADIDGDGRNELVSNFATYDDQGRLDESGLQVFEVDANSVGTPTNFPVASPFRFEQGYEWNGDLAWIAIYRDGGGNEFVYGGISDNLKSADVDGDGKEEVFGLQNRAEIGRRPDGTIDVGLSHDAITKGLFWGWDGAAMVERSDMAVKGFAPALYGVYSYDFMDFNFDGHLDLVVPRWDAPDGAPLQVFINDGAGRFKAIETRLLPKEPAGGDNFVGDVLDVNGDRIMDIFVHTDNHSEAGPDWGSYSEAMYLGTTRFDTGPGYTDPALRGAAGFNEQYYLNTYADAAKAVRKGKFDDGLDHYLSVGKGKGYLGFAVDTHIYGTDRSDIIKTREGEERLDGGLGKDTLTGAGSSDTFVFSTKLGSTNVDTIKDFKPAKAT